MQRTDPRVIVTSKRGCEEAWVDLIYGRDVVPAFFRRACREAQPSANAQAVLRISG